MKNPCLQCRVNNARAEAVKHPSMTAYLMVAFMRTPRAISNNKPCTAHDGVEKVTNNAS